MPVSSDAIGQAATDLGLGADLQAQVKDETEEERKKRLMRAQLSPGAMSLLGPSMGIAGASRGLTGGGY